MKLSNVAGDKETKIADGWAKIKDLPAMSTPSGDLMLLLFFLFSKPVFVSF